MVYTDTLDKIVLTYMAAVTRVPFEYKGQQVEPKRLVVSPMLFRDYTCPPMCGGCCVRFSLVYLPSEPRPESELPDWMEGQFRKRWVRLNGQRRLLWEDPQTDHNDHFCRHLDRSDGRCGIHGRHPFSCDFELLRVLAFDDHHVLLTKLYGRGWAFERIDTERGAQCEIVPMSSEGHADIVRKLGRLGEWADYLGFADTHIARVKQWAETGPHAEPLVLEPG